MIRVRVRQSQGVAIDRGGLLKCYPVLAAVSSGFGRVPFEFTSSVYCISWQASANRRFGFEHKRASGQQPRAARCGGKEEASIRSQCPVLEVEGEEWATVPSCSGQAKNRKGRPRVSSEGERVAHRFKTQKRKGRPPKRFLRIGCAARPFIPSRKRNFKSRAEIVRKSTDPHLLSG